MSSLGVAESDLGIGNRLTCWTTRSAGQPEQGAAAQRPEAQRRLASRDFTVEMETGTGKTYVYLRTIFELNKRYGFTKFVIVVPSVAIKEGVYKSCRSPRSTSSRSMPASPSTTSCTTPAS
jgi:type III restriction enzyme